MDELRDLLGKSFLETDHGFLEIDRSGCQFVEESVWQNVTIQILRCERCGRRTIAWWKQKDSVEVPDGIAGLEREQREQYGNGGEVIDT